MTPDQFRKIIREEFLGEAFARGVREIVRGEIAPLGAEVMGLKAKVETLVAKVGDLETKVDTIHRDLLSLRVELQGVVDERFRPIAAG